MSLPTFIALEGAADDEQSYPVSIAWSLSDGSIKQALIYPDADWREDEASLVTKDAMDLDLHGYAADEVVRELLYDQEDDVLYVDALHPQEAWLLKLFAAADQEVGFQLIEALELYDDPDTWQETRREAMEFLGLDPSRAEDQVRALLEAHVILTGDQPDISD
ncbi:hypothetical protein SAMN05660443_1509 [Marinospirillum celere]|uniref:Uncharacterized protein n=1 Tax=Marinospirillum celere TaxID=1122252 RepID=A0A1I1GTB8_9GAMM|nr:hypothetical protein [Marinospirillum celere]SFC12453.1 hypothetical protein SAMN05660443_1509 [Marinospirillum celere]